jgi:hypothetical protein|nr:MAG TPA: tail fiber protein [Caudoviricetes sp.]
MINKELNRVDYKGDGQTVSFPIPFDVISKTDVKAILVTEDGKEKVITEKFYIDMNDKTFHYPSNGKDVDSSNLIPMKTGERLILVRDIPITQENTYGEKYPFDSIERMDDKLILIAQDLKMEHNRVLKLPISAKDDIDMTLPKPVPDSTFAWDSEGKKLIPCINPTVAMERAENAAKQTEEDRQAVSVMKSGVDSVLSDATTKAQQLRDTIENGKRELSEYVENAKLQTQAQTESVNSKLNEYNQKAEETSGALENKTQELNSIVSNATESINNSKRQIESSVNEAKESVNAIKSSLDNYYTKPQIDNKLSGLGGGGGVTANEVDEKINAAGEALLQLVETHIPKKLSQLELDPINQLNVKSIINLTTPEESDNSNKAATTEFVARAISKIPNGGAIPPEILNTIQENKTGLSTLKGKVSAVETNLSNKQDKGNYAHLVGGKVPKNELPNLKSWLNEENIKTGSMEVWKYD